MLDVRLVQKKNEHKCPRNRGDPATTSHHEHGEPALLFLASIKGQLPLASIRQGRTVPQACRTSFYMPYVGHIGTNTTFFTLCFLLYRE